MVPTFFFPWSVVHKKGSKNLYQLWIELPSIVIQSGDLPQTYYTFQTDISATVCCEMVQICSLVNFQLWMGDSLVHVSKQCSDPHQEIGFVFVHVLVQQSITEPRDLSIYICLVRSQHREQVRHFSLYLPLSGPLTCFSWHASTIISIIVMLLSGCGYVQRN